MTDHPSAKLLTVRGGLLLTALAFLAACSPDQAILAPASETQLVTDAASALQGGGRFVAGEVIVKFRDGVTAA